MNSNLTSVQFARASVATAEHDSDTQKTPTQVISQQGQVPHRFGPKHVYFAPQLHNLLPSNLPGFPLRPCAADMDISDAGDRHQQTRSPRGFRKPGASRLEMLQAWRARTGLSTGTQVQDSQRPAPASRAVGPRGGVLPIASLDLVVRHLLTDAPRKTSPRAVLWAFAAASRRLRYVAAPYIYERVVLKGNGDAGVYARTGNAKLVRSLTIEFEPHDPWNAFSALMDQMLYPGPTYKPTDIQEAGIEYFFPRCTELSFVARFAPEEAREAYFAGAQIFGSEFGEYIPEPGRSRLYESPSFLASKLVQLIPSGVKRIRLSADIPEVAAMFVVTVMTREGDPEDDVHLEIVSRLDEVVQSVEDAIHLHDPHPLDPTPARTHIVIRGPTHGATITWDQSALEEAPLQSVWRQHRPRSKHPRKIGRQPSSAGKQTQTAPEQRYSPETPRRSMRKTSSPYKRPLPNTTLEPATPPSPRDQMELDDPVPTPGPSKKTMASPAGSMALVCDPFKIPPPSGPPPGQEEAWRAGRLVAEMPSILRRTIVQVNQSRPDLSASTSIVTNKGKYSDFWRFVDILSEGQSRIGLWHPSARAELDTFLNASAERRISGYARVAKLMMMKEMRDRARAEAEKMEKRENKAKAGGKRKRARRA